MNANDKLETLQKQEEILKSLIRNLENQKQRLEVEETELLNYLNKEETRLDPPEELATTSKNNEDQLPKEIDLSLNLVSKINQQVEEEEDDDDE